MVNCDYPSSIDLVYVTNPRARCWACGRLLKPTDKFGDTCNKCALVSVFKSMFNSTKQEKTDELS